MATKNITNYKLVNPSAADDYYDNAATATTDTTQPAINLGRALNLGTSASTQSAGMQEVLLGDRGRTVFASQVRVGPHTGALSANLGAAVGSVTVAANGGFAKYTKTGHGRSVGDIINVSDTNDIVQGPAQITSVPLSSTFVTNQPYASGAGTVDYRVAAGNFATMTAEKYIIRRVTDEIHGVSNTVLRSGGSDYGIRRSIHKVETAFRHLAVATAVRAGYWDIFSGTFSTAPTATNDSVGDVAGSTITDGTADHAATPTRSVPGELVYKQSGAQTAGTASTDGTFLDDYKAKTGG